MFLWNGDITFAKIDRGLISILTWHCHTAVLIKSCLSALSFSHTHTDSLALFSPFIIARVVMRIRITHICKWLPVQLIFRLYLYNCSWLVRVNQYAIDSWLNSTTIEKECHLSEKIEWLHHISYVEHQKKSPQMAVMHTVCCRLLVSLLQMSPLLLLHVSCTT